MGAIIVGLLPVLVQALKDTPEVINDVRDIWGLVTSKTPATAEQQSTIDAALDEAHAALQAS